MTKRLSGKVAIVTGASRGIGAAIAKRFGAEGAKVVLVARTLEPGGSRLAGSLHETAAWIEAHGGECHCLAANLAKEDQRAAIVPETVGRFGGVDILINNAAWCRYQGSHTQALKDVRQTFEINVVTPLDLTRQALPSMQQRGGGWVVNLSSATVNLPRPAPYDMAERYTKFNLQSGPSIYAASKAALDRMTAGMAVELAQYNVAVNTLAPVEAVMSEGAIEIGTVDAEAILEPAEAMAEAALELSTRPASELSGRIVLSLHLLKELGIDTVRSLDGRQPMTDFTF